MTRAQLTYEEWEFIEPHLPIGEYGPYLKTCGSSSRDVIRRFRPAGTGGHRREMPSEFGAWPTVCTGARRSRRPLPAPLDGLDRRPHQGDSSITTRYAS
ncbi:hypothetical protein ACIOEW_15465 [Streptomyces sp. NPDC087901]|uniref:hypothetical protein n=1 Tax=Streptomyces sp. NPDC087901 TaxID=3365818 RepID=UPI00380F5969